MGNVSVLNKENRLQSALTSPQDLTAEERSVLLAACKSQGSLASYSSEKYEFNQTSLNTLKSHADDTLDEGFEGLDRLRKSVLQVLSDLESKRTKPSRGTLAELRIKNSAQEKTIQTLTNEIASMTVKLDEVMKLGAAMAKETKQLDIFNKKQREIFTKFGG